MRELSNVTTTKLPSIFQEPLVIAFSAWSSPASGAADLTCKKPNFKKLTVAAHSVSVFVFQVRTRHGLCGGNDFGADL